VRPLRLRDRYRSVPSPVAEAVDKWTADQYSGALRHDRKNPLFNPHLRQLLHVGYKIASKMGPRYIDMLVACEPSISRNVTEICTAVTSNPCS